MCSCGAPRFTISPTFGRSRSTATVSTLSRVEKTLNEPRPDHGSPSRTVVRAPTVDGARSSDGRRSVAQSRDRPHASGGGQHSARGQHRGSSGVIAFTIRRAVCRCHLLSPSPPRAAPTRRSDDQSTACPALPMPSRAAGRSPRREEPVEEVLIRLFAPWPRWRASAAF